MTDIGLFSATKLSYALDQYYELSKRAAGSCDFAGNATVVSTGPSSSDAAAAAVSSCAALAPTGAATPAEPASTAPSQGGAATASGAASTAKSAAMGLADARSFGGVLALTVLGALAGAVVVI